MSGEIIYPDDDKKDIPTIQMGYVIYPNGVEVEPVSDLSFTTELDPELFRMAVEASLDFLRWAREQDEEAKRNWETMKGIPWGEIQFRDEPDD